MTAPLVHLEPMVSEALLLGLAALGVEQAFGLVGGAVAPFCDALGRSPLTCFQLRHEAGALFAAVEASLATGRPTLAFVTTGPGLLNALTGAMAARWEGARVVLVSGVTSATQRGRWAVQESGPRTLPADAVYRAGTVFHDACILERAADLPDALARLAVGFSRPEGFVAHLGIPIAVQRARTSACPVAAPAVPGTSGGDGKPLPSDPSRPFDPTAAIAALDAAPFVIWAGFGARGDAAALRAFAERTGAPVMCTPRGKGIFPEDHPQYLGVTGCGGHDAVEARIRDLGCRRVLVLGSRLGEFSSCWAPGLVPPDGIIHVDLDTDVFGAAYPDVPTLGVRADVGTFLRVVSGRVARRPAAARPADDPEPPGPGRPGVVRPQALMHALQRSVVDVAPIMAESGNAFLWANGRLRFSAPGGYRVSGLWGSMGHATSGVFGLAVARGKAFALVGDGAMLMMNEVSSAVQYGMPAVWVVLNDARMGIVDGGMRGIGLTPFHTDLPPTDFAALARALGATGERVAEEADLGAALTRALAAPGPHVVDVLIDPDQASPFARRVSTLNAMGANAR